MTYTYLSLDLYAEITRPGGGVMIDGYPVDMVRLKLIDWLGWETDLLFVDTPQYRSKNYGVDLLFCWFRDRLKQHNDELLEESITNIATFDIVNPISLEGLIDEFGIGNMDRDARIEYRYDNAQKITEAEAFVPLEREHLSQARTWSVSKRALKSLLNDCEKVLADPEQAFLLFHGDGKAEEIAKIINKNHVVEMCKFTQPRLAKILEDTDNDKVDCF